MTINGEGIPAALWGGLILGAILTVGFTYLFGVENFRLQMIMTGLLGALIGLMFAGEYAIRRRVLPQVPRRGILAAVRVYFASSH